MIKSKQIQRPQLVLVVDYQEINRDALGVIWRTITRSFTPKTAGKRWKRCGSTPGTSPSCCWT